MSQPHTLVLGATGTVGSRVLRGLVEKQWPCRGAGRRTPNPFDWARPGTWRPTLSGADSLFLLLPDDRNLPDGFLEVAVRSGVQRVVLLSDRNAEVMGVTRLLEAERAVRDLIPEWSVVRPDWFFQDFETFFRGPALDGMVRVPIGKVRQGFVDAGDVAGVAVACLTNADWDAETLELTGPEALSFPDALAVVSGVVGRPLSFDGSPAGYREQGLAAGVLEDALERQLQGFAALRAAGDVQPTSTVDRVLGRSARPFTSYVEEAAERGVWAR